MNWDRESDVLVVGGGGAGLAAAVSAAEEGATVLLCEKAPRLGGTTSLAVGSVTACGTSLQEQAEVRDRWQDQFEDMGKFAGPFEPRANHALRELLCTRGGETLEWLRSLGVEFFGPSPEPPHRVPRMHNARPNAWGLVLALQCRAASLGVKVLFSCRVNRLCTDAGGRVEGVEAARGGRNLRLRARRSVVLASGDYSSSRDLKRRFLGDRAAGLSGYNPYNEGDGHLMGQEAGGRLVNMDVYRGPGVRFVPLPENRWHGWLPRSPGQLRRLSLAYRFSPRPWREAAVRRLLTTRGSPSAALWKEGALWVNRRGERFANELAGAEWEIPRQEGGTAFLVFDRRVAEQFECWPHFISTVPEIAYAYVSDYLRRYPDVARSGATLEEAGRLAGVDPAGLARTGARYNGFVNRGRDEDFGRSPLGAGLREPPFYVFGPARSTVNVTKGGLAVTPEGRVLKEGGGVVEGLFAAGSVGQGGLLLMGHGLQIGWALTSGRVAGRGAARNAFAT